MDFKPIIEKNLQVLMNKYKKSKERFKANAYQRAYNALPDNVYTVDDVKDVGGAKTFEKLKFMIENNKDLPEVEEYMNDGSHAIIEQLQTVYGIGPAKATKLYNQHNVRSLEDLKTKTDLLDDKQMLGLQYYDDILARIPYKEMEKHDDFVQSEVAKMMHNKNITDENLKYAIVGSYRRKLKDSGDIDILLTGEQNYLGILITTLIEKGYIVGTAVLATGLTFCIASVVGRRMSDSVGQALSGVVGLGLVGLIIAMVVQLIGSFFAPATFAVGTFELMISGFGTVLFVGMSFVDFYTMPRRYNDDQYLAGALGMYLTYINLFIFILRLIIALQGGGRRD